jgi:exodeoxyribonuclease V gamma subunit
MAALDAAARAGSQDADAAPARPWLVRHPQQPFDPRYFDGTDAALFSFRAGFAAMRSAGVAAEPFVATAAPHQARADAGAAAPAPVALAEVLAYYRNPARQLLAHGLNLRLRALDDDGLRASEPLDGRFEAIDRVSRRLFFDAVAAPEPALPEAPPDWIGLSGLLPPGRLGAAAWQRERDAAQQLLAAIADHAAFAGGLAPNHPLAIDCVVADRYAVRGELRRVHRRGDTFWVVDVFPSMREDKDLSFKARIGLFLEWALLRLDATTAGAAVHVCAVLAGQRATQFERAFDKWDAAFVAAAAGAQREAMRRELEQRIGGVLAFWAQSQQQPQWYFPLASWAALDGEAAAVRARWLGQRGMTGERDYAPGYARLLAGEREFDDGADFAALCANATALHALTDLGQPLAPAP